MIEITVNGEKRQVEPGTVLTDYITSLDLNPATVVVEYNREIVKREEYGSLILEQGCELELIRFIGGG